MRLIIAIAFLGCAAGVSAQTPAGGPGGDAPANAATTFTGEQAAIRNVLDVQAAAWNRGDIDAFMDGYWRSPDLRFGSGGRVTYGWDETLANYKRRYPDRAAMGALSFSDVGVQLLSDDAAVVHGRWRLEREADAPSGLYTLIFRKKAGRWLIVSDTTTSAG